MSSTGSRTRCEPSRRRSVECEHWMSSPSARLRRHLSALAVRRGAAHRGRARPPEETAVLAVHPDSGGQVVPVRGRLAALGADLRVTRLHHPSTKNGDVHGPFAPATGTSRQRDAASRARGKRCPVARRGPVPLLRKPPRHAVVAPSRLDAQRVVDDLDRIDR